ncbi:MAG: GNVR domain-containing protein [Pseudomonadota bacterium]
MINSARSYSIIDYVEIFKRRIWYFIIPFFIILPGTILYAVYAPRIYKASTLVLVSPQKVPEAFVQSTVTSRIEERLQSISQEVMSRTRLEQVMDEFKLYREESKNLSKEQLVGLMQKNIKVELPSRKEEKTYFTIAYTGINPEIVAAVANRLTSLFIEENLKLREQQATGTTEFLTAELASSKKRLEELEMQVSLYKKRYMGELPEQLDTSLKILEQLQNQYQRIGENLNAAQDRKLFIQKQISDLESPTTASETGTIGLKDNALAGPLSASANRLAPAQSGAKNKSSYELQKDALTKLLDELTSQYTENHPDVIITKKKLADLETKHESDEDTVQELYNLKKDPRYIELNNQLQIVDLEIKQYQTEIVSISKQITIYRTRIENIPSREQEMASLMREYSKTKENYETLFKKSQEAQQAENLEFKQKGEQFKIIDPARVPEKPFSPDINKVLLIGFALCIGCSIGLVILREQMDTSFHDAEDVELVLGLRVIATIPTIEKEAA